MTQGPLNWLYPAIALTLSTVAFLLILWGLFSDRARGRKRCPRCWYDMAAGLLTCPECGHTARSEAALLHTRRRWMWIAAGLALLVVAQSVRMTPRAIARGARGLIPTFVLARWWPMDIDGWLQSGSLAPLAWSRDPMIEEWFARWEEGIGISDSAAWLDRVESRFETLNDSTDPTGRTLAIYDLRPILSDIAPILRPRRHPWGFGLTEMPSCIESFTAPDEWESRGGSTAELWPMSSGAIVRASPHVHSEVRALLALLAATSRRGSAGTDQTSWESTLSLWRRLERAQVPPIEPQHSVADILRAASRATGVDCNAMSSDYFRSMIGFDEPRGMELPEASAIVVLDALVDTLRENPDTAHCSWMLDDGSIRLVSTDAHRATPSLRAFNVSDRLAALAASEREDAVVRLAAEIRGMCFPEEWIDHGGEWRLEAFADRIIVRAPLPLICKVALYLERTANEPITPGPAAPGDAGPPEG